MRMRFLKPLNGWRAFLGEVGIIVKYSPAPALAASDGPRKDHSTWSWRRACKSQTPAS